MESAEARVSESAGAGPGRPRSERAGRAILDATLELLADVGYDRLTLARVARRAGVGKATLYRRWASKPSLVAAAFERFPELAEPDTGHLVDDLVDVLRSFIRICSATPLAFVLPILAGESARDPELEKMLAPVFHVRRRPLLRVLERAAARSELPPDIDLEAAADVIMGPIVTRLFFTGAELGEQHVAPLVDAALFGINRLRTGG